MRLALVTTPPSLASGIGDYAHQLLPYLAERVDVEVFVAPDHAGEPCAVGACRSAAELARAGVDRVLYQIGNERAHAYMLPTLRRVGGVVMLHDWILFDLAAAAFPALERGGFKGHAVAYREGGLASVRVYAANRLRQRLQREAESTIGDGPLLFGWHAPEPGGRWTARRAALRPPRGTERVELEVALPPHRALRASEMGVERARLVARRRPCQGRLAFAPGAPAFELVCDRVVPTAEQRAHGDTRELGAFVRGARARVDGVWVALDLEAPAARPLRPVLLADDRFRLPLNRSVLDAADAFVVHSEWMQGRVAAARGREVPIARVPHGAERHARDVDRAALRVALGLPESFREAVVVTTFGAIQDHKRPGVLLDAFARALDQAPELRLVLAGAVRTEEIDVPSRVEELGVAHAVHVTGFLPEEAITEHLLASDVCVNLRGPSTGGTSGGIARALGAGRPVIASDLAEQRELPAGAVVRIAQDAREVGRLATRLVALARDADQRAAMEAAARRYVDREAHWSHVARAYVDALLRFPAPSRAIAVAG